MSDHITRRLGAALGSWVAPHVLLRLALALVLGALGGAAFFALKLPLPWMLGAMALATIAAMARAPIAVPPRLRNAMVAILGVLLGSQFTRDTFERIAEWYVGIVGVVVSVTLMVAVAMLIFRKLGGYDRPTAFFAAMPGGLSEMMVLGEAMGGDGRKVSLSHAARILVAVFLIAFYYRLFEDYTPVGLPVTPLSAIAWHDIALLIGCAAVGYPAFRLLRVPAAQLVGPLVLSAALHVSGIVEAEPPGELIAAAQVVLGAAIGARFAGTSVRDVWRTIALATMVAVLMVVIAGGAAYVLGAISGAAPTALFLALAPGGLAEMSLIALSFGNAAAFVSTHHIVRIILIVILAPALYRLAARAGRG